MANFAHRLDTMTTFGDFPPISTRELSQPRSQDFLYTQVGENPRNEFVSKRLLSLVLGCAFSLYPPNGKLALELQPVAIMLRHCHENTTFLASNRY